MTLSLVTQDDALRRLADRGHGAADSTERLSEILRAEVHARKHAQRAATLSRVARLLAPAVLVDETRLDEVCSELEREGDLLLAPGGILYATPTRAVAIRMSARVFSSVPTPVLAEGLGQTVTANGATRTVASTDGLADAVAKLRGVMVSPEAWAGLDRTPKADAAFLAKLDQQLEWESLGAGSLERDGSLDWRTWQVSEEGARWWRGNEGRLWWARTRFGGHLRAWTTGASPSTCPFIVLSPDDADRSRFALSRDEAAASTLRIQRSGERVTLELPGWLPRPEYRWLSLHAAPLVESKRMRWEVGGDDEIQITKLLADRLGLVPMSSGEAS